MVNSFYLELSEMAQEALDALDRYESTGQGGDVFDKIRAVGVPCLDGQKISQSVKDDLPIRDQLEFQRAIFSMVNISYLTKGIGKNSNIRAQISYVLSKSKTLSSRSKRTKTLKIFYSWQATLPSKTNRGLIRTCLDKAISEINKGLSIESRVSLDHDTSNTPGSPDIINTILEKIDSSQIFVADVSLVNTSQPNVNVMFELGYAMKTLGDQNIIMVFNENYGATKDLPFDLGLKRQMLYSCSDSEEDMSSIRRLLTSKLKSAILLILDNE